jgi:hypothetical protein
MPIIKLHAWMIYLFFVFREFVLFIHQFLILIDDVLSIYFLKVDDKML